MKPKHRHYIATQVGASKSFAILNSIKIDCANSHLRSRLASHDLCKVTPGNLSCSTRCARLMSHQHFYSIKSMTSNTSCRQTNGMFHNYFVFFFPFRRGAGNSPTTNSVNKRGEWADRFRARAPRRQSTLNRH